MNALIYETGWELGYAQGHKEGLSAGAYALAGMILMGEAIKARPLGVCSSCGYDGLSDHWDDAYGRDLYRAPDRTVYCGHCADQLKIDGDEIVRPTSEGSKK